MNFIADNPYGVTEKGKNKSDSGHDTVNWDDYNTFIDKSYSPLIIKWNKTGNEDYDKNVKAFALSLVNNKKDLLKKFNLTSDEYNRLTELALGIAELETKYGTSTSYKIKNFIGENGVSFLKGIQSAIKPKYGRNLLKGWNLKEVIKHSMFPAISYLSDYSNGISKAQSRGYTQIKNKGDNKKLQDIYKNLGIESNNIKTPEKSALATMSRLAYMYNSEVKGKHFKGADNKEIDPYDALLYKWNGHNSRLKNKKAIPKNNEYILNVNKYSNKFNFFEDRTYNVFD